MVPNIIEGSASRWAVVLPDDGASVNKIFFFSDVSAMDDLT